MRAKSVIEIMSSRIVNPLLFSLWISRIELGNEDKWNKYCSTNFYGGRLFLYRSWSLYYNFIYNLIIFISTVFFVSRYQKSEIRKWPIYQSIICLDYAYPYVFWHISWKKRKYIYPDDMSDYITNSKNRKLKTKIVLFLSRINIWAGKLPISGRMIIIMEWILFTSLFFPWLSLTYLDWHIQKYSAFSQLSLYIWYSIILAIVVIPFFLLSHTKKERIRALVPFRLSDTQAIVFVISILLTCLINIIIVNNLFSAQIAGIWSSISTGFKIAFSAIALILISTFFLSKSIKTTNTDICYLDHQVPDELNNYKWILGEDDSKNKKNMSLPI